MLWKYCLHRSFPYKWPSCNIFLPRPHIAFIPHFINKVAPLWWGCRDFRYHSYIQEAGFFSLSRLNKIMGSALLSWVCAFPKNSTVISFLFRKLKVHKIAYEKIPSWFFTHHCQSLEAIFAWPGSYRGLFCFSFYPVFLPPSLLAYYPTVVCKL